MAVTKTKPKIDPIKRFSDRVNNYIKYRPGYPAKIIDYLKAKKILKNNSVIADIGSGTGKLTEIFLKNKNKVYGIEPNQPMRKGAEKVLRKFRNFISINGSAEKTGLKDNSVDLIIAGQAFHWFDLKKTKPEFRRILREKGNIALVWNDRSTDNPENKSFLEEYELLLEEFGTDFKKVRQNNIDKKTLDGFFKSRYNKIKFYNYQIFDFKGLKGRLLSSSYIPLKPGTHFNHMISKLRLLFNKYQANGKVKFDYICELYVGKI